MEQRGLIEREVDEQDRRHRVLQLTDRGRQELRASTPVADAIDAALLERLAPEEREQLHGLLGKLASSRAPDENAASQN
jgi:DNA-binding MarR family transcriptional regulator